MGVIPMDVPMKCVAKLLEFLLLRLLVTIRRANTRNIGKTLRILRRPRRSLGLVLAVPFRAYDSNLDGMIDSDRVWERCV